MKKPITRREFAQSMAYYAASFGKPADPVPKKRELKHSDEPSEHQLQCRVIAWWNKAHEQFGLPNFALYAVPNGGSRHLLEAANLKSEGVRKGIPDLQMDVPRGQFHGLRIEMKRKGGKVSDEQESVHTFLEEQGFLCVVCYNDQDAIDAIKGYLSCDVNSSPERRIAEMRAAINGLLKFHQEGDDGAELPREYWTPGYREAVEVAEALAGSDVDLTGSGKIHRPECG